MLYFFLPPPSETTMVRTAILVHSAGVSSDRVCSVISSQVQARGLIEEAGVGDERRAQTLALCDATFFAEDGTSRIDLGPAHSMLACVMLADARVVQQICGLSVAGRPVSGYAQGAVLPREAGHPGLVMVHDGASPVIHVVHDRPGAKAALDGAHRSWGSRLRYGGREQLAACALPERSERPTQTIRGFAAHALSFSIGLVIGSNQNLPRS